MYYPKQIPYLLDEEFKSNVTYQEYIITELKDYCFCFWQMKSMHQLNKTIPNNVLPDACIDIVIDFVSQTICFAGFSKETVELDLTKEIDYLGVRFRPGAFYALYNIEAAKIMDKQIPFRKIEKEENIDEIFTLKEEEKRREYLKKYLLKKIISPPKKDFITMVDKIYKNPTNQSVNAISKDFGYNERQLYRLFMTNYGVSPKVLLNILRLHLCLNLLLFANIKLIDIAFQCGFYDQAHFIKEIKRYTKMSPLQILNQKEL